ncbi:MAG TPA: ester cyclase [Chitinophagaceae bacterium]|nr:ester cyclase [Chitinophagaceae bacterium]
MNETLMEKEVASKTQSNMEAYFRTHDVQYVAQDAVFINLATGEETKGREAIGEMLHFIYHVAFDAKAEIKNQVITESKALIEADFKGRHIGEFAGIAPTNKEVNVPLCVSYDLEEGLVKTARIYMLVNVMMQQLQG